MIPIDATQITTLLIVLFTLMIISGILAFVFWLMMLIDASKHEFEKEEQRMVWVLIIIILNGIGALAYYFSVRLRDKRKEKLEKHAMKTAAPEEAIGKVYK